MKRRGFLQLLGLSPVAPALAKIKSEPVELMVKAASPEHAAEDIEIVCWTTCSVASFPEHYSFRVRED